MTTYGIGRLVPGRARERLGPKALGWVARYGSGATFFAWLPIVGDTLALAAGWLRLAWPAVLMFMATGRLARYLVVAHATLA